MVASVARVASIARKPESSWASGALERCSLVVGDHAVGLFVDLDRGGTTTRHSAPPTNISIVDYAHHNYH